MNDKILVILCGSEESIQYFNEGVLPSFDAYEKSDYGRLHIKEEDMKSNDVIGDTKKAINFIYDDESTKYINNIFLFIHSVDLDFIKRIATDIKNEFSKKFKTIKFVYLTTEEEPLEQDQMDKLVEFQREVNFDYDIEDMMKGSSDIMEIQNIRDRLYLLGDAIDISVMLNEVPSEVREIILQKFNQIISEI